MRYELANEWMRFYRGAAAVASETVAHQSKATVSPTCYDAFGLPSALEARQRADIRGECHSPSKSLVVVSLTVYLRAI